MARHKRQSDAALKELRAFGLAYPGAHTKSPWPGHLDLAVNDKTFAYLSLEGEPFGISCKLPRSSSIALMLPFVKPAGYGLGKSGWVQASPPEDEDVPIDLFKEWIDESYRAQAPKRLIAQLSAAGGGAAGSDPSKAGRAAKPTAKKGAIRKADGTAPARQAAARKVPATTRKVPATTRKAPAATTRKAPAATRKRAAAKPTGRRSARA